MSFCKASHSDLILLIEKKLNTTLNLAWKEVQQKASQLFRSMNFDHFKFDEFMDILTILHKMIEYGDAFTLSHASVISNQNCKILLTAVKDQTLAYFRSIHM
jgi:hypothetical protein